ncbi:MAG: Zinc dependent phospholipase C [Phormidesmis priestleyi Ana]|uniref:Zinc dependent phospholipase C n=1 Tax=Phormidesmis priestleyi Ana TaxID=1666911 RepID=A0A0P8DIE2_9CYAN|nr:MAG: Zinc dependent phospholipase C [Phormidesmis priestleyi Ana]
MLILLWLILGSVLALIFVTFARTEPTRERAILAAGLVVAAFIYVVLAFAGGSSDWIGIEMLGLVMYGLAAVLGVYYSSWWLAFGWAAHPVWDICLHLLGMRATQGIGATFAPEWYIYLCIGLDISVATYIVRSHLSPALRLKNQNLKNPKNQIRD